MFLDECPNTQLPDYLTEGCVLIEVVNTTVTCGCNHLTTFAILMEFCQAELNIQSGIWKVNHEKFTHQLYALSELSEPLAIAVDQECICFINYADVSKNSVMCLCYTCTCITSCVGPYLISVVLVHSCPTTYRM